MIRVLLVGSYCRPAACFGGPSEVLFDLAAGLAGRGFDAEVITTAANEPQDDEARIENIDNVKTQYVNRWRNNRWFFSPSLGHAVWKAAPSFDVLHIHGLWLWSTAVASAAARTFGIPYVLMPHGTLDPWALGHKAEKKHLYLSLIEKRNLVHAAAVHCLTEREKEQVHSVVSDARCEVIANAVTIDPTELTDLDRQLFRQKFPTIENKQVVLFLSRIDPKKGLDILIPAFAALFGRTKNAHLLIAGSGNFEYVEAMKDLVKEFGIENEVTFAGLLVGREKLAALDAASVFVLPSRGEGLPMAVLEAMAFKIPIVITKECNLDNAALGRGAGIIVQGNPKSLADEMARVMSHKTEAKQMGEAGAALIQEHFALNEVVKKLGALFEEIVLTNKKER
jgi:glycosyltransferase involved in cell wall biosynthesis